MKKKFTITEEDYFHYQWHMFKANPTAKRTMYIQMAMPIVVFIAIAIFYYATGKELKGLLPLGLVLVLWPFLYQFFFNRSMKKKLKQLIRKMKKDLPIGDHHATIDEKGVQDGDVEFAYDDIRYVMEGDGGFYYIFYKDAPSAYLLPKDMAADNVKSKIQ